MDLLNTKEEGLNPKKGYILRDNYTVEEMAPRKSRTLLPWLGCFKHKKTTLFPPKEQGKRVVGESGGRLEKEAVEEHSFRRLFHRLGA